MSGIEIAAVFAVAANFVYGLSLMWNGYREGNGYKLIGAALVFVSPALFLIVAGLHILIFANQLKREGIE